MFDAKLYLMETENEFGRLVAEYRQKKNLSQRELAEKIKMSATYINYVERGFNPSAKDGKFQASRNAVDKIAKAIDIPLDAARRAAGYAPKNSILPDELKDIPFNQLDKKSLDEIRNFVLYLIHKKTDELRETPDVHLKDVQHDGELDDVGRKAA